MDLTVRPIIHVLEPHPVCFFGGKKINPSIGAAGVSAVPMSARVVQKFVADETNGRVNPLYAAMGPNLAGVIGTAMAAGIFLALLK